MPRPQDYSTPKLFWEERLAKNFDLTSVGYGSLGPVYNSLIYLTRLNALVDALEKANVSLKGKNVLEVGCGTGFYIDFLKLQGINSYTGLDITEISVQNLSKRYTDIQFLQADIGDENFSLNHKFDIVLIADVLFHIIDDERFETAITNISNHLLPEATIIISDLFTRFSVDSKQHCNWRSISQYESVLMKNGLTIQHIQPVFAIFHPPVRVPGTSLLWQFYALFWQYVLLRFARFNWFDRDISNLLCKIDRKVFLPHAGINTPNVKWLIAQNDVG
ncbi:MAG: hypothetical protein A2029_08490 [Chloroflexi bacterium RBG_19FT_COMBO_47_9]|nr:MAG: hypothetical protein A2029_08490 [Chloroflexi bacterium RBG_19FT_COMBO_47_9]